MDAILRGKKALAYYRSLSIGDDLEALAVHLNDLGYSRYSSRSILICLRMVAEYLQKEGLGLADLATEQTLAGFRAYWLECSVARYGRTPTEPAFRKYEQSIESLLESARRTGVLAPKEVDPEPPLHPLLQEYLDFQRDHRGLAKSSLHTHMVHLETLLAYAEDRGFRELVNLPLSVLDSFTEHQSARYERKTVGVTVWILRTFLGYLFFAGYEDRDRSKQISLPLTYRQMSLPKHLTDQQLAQALSLVDRATVYGKRNWAILMVLSCLGLRADEVRRLRICDVDLDGKRLRVDRAKGEGSQVFPLTPPVEEALRIYIEQARPNHTDHQELFLTFRPPVRPFPSGSSIGNVVGFYLKKVPGLHSHGSHALRFTFARRLRKAGAPLAVIRRTMGHSLLDTTGIYLRIAYEELREVADNYAELL